MHGSVFRSISISLILFHLCLVCSWAHIFLISVTYFLLLLVWVIFNSLVLLILVLFDSLFSWPFFWYFLNLVLHIKYTFSYSILENDYKWNFCHATPVAFFLTQGDFFFYLIFVIYNCVHIFTGTLPVEVLSGLNLFIYLFTYRFILGRMHKWEGLGEGKRMAPAW